MRNKNLVTMFIPFEEPIDFNLQLIEQTLSSFVEKKFREDVKELLGEKSKLAVMYYDSNGTKFVEYIPTVVFSIREGEFVYTESANQKEVRYRLDQIKGYEVSANPNNLELWVDEINGSETYEDNFIKLKDEMKIDIGLKEKPKYKPYSERELKGEIIELQNNSFDLVLTRDFGKAWSVTRMENVNFSFQGQEIVFKNSDEQEIERIKLVQIKEYEVDVNSNSLKILFNAVGEKGRTRNCFYR